MRTAALWSRARLALTRRSAGCQCFQGSIPKPWPTRTVPQPSWPAVWTVCTHFRDTGSSHNLQHTANLHGRKGRRRSDEQPGVASATSAAEGSSDSSSDPTSSKPTLSAAIGKFVADQFLPLGLLGAMLVGYVAPESGLAASQWGLIPYTTSGIFLIQGLNLKRGEALRALSSWGATLYGAASILFVTPLLALVALRLPLTPPEFAFGLAVFCCMPTTLSSGVSLTQAVGGNTALALLLTVGTNLAGIFTMPFILAALLGASTSGISLEPTALLVNLVQTILLPLLTGAAARTVIPGMAGWVDGHKQALTLLSACLLITVPWVQISKAVTSGVAISAASLAAVVAAGVAIHLVYLAFNMAAVNLLKIGGPRGPDAAAIERAVILVTSQKTLPVAVTVLSQVGAALPGGAAGLAVIPCVAAHMSQIVFDSFLVSYWLDQDRQRSTAAPKLA